ncbi:MAG: aldo/keto reductase [Alphaproteobacteria bacterium]|nr:aldo/keto reductase [Alphaproteobacteria bacterium]
MTSAQPIIALNDGTTVPQLGFGVWEIGDDATVSVLKAAFAAGFRHIDCAQAYGNERGVGRAVRASDLIRTDLFVTTKMRTSHFAHDKALKSVEDSLERMGLDYVDLFLLHWPVPSHDGLFVAAWKALIEMREAGRIRSIGVSNFLPEHLDRLIGETGIPPAVNQLELHPRFQQRDVRAVHDKLGIAIACYSPLGRGALLDEPAVAKIAKAHAKSPAQAIIRWHLQQGLIVLPKTATLSRIAENFDVFDFDLSEAEMAAIGALDRPDGRILPDPRHMNNLF